MNFGLNKRISFSRELRINIFNRIRDAKFRIDYLHPWQDYSSIGKAQWIRDEFAVYGERLYLTYCQYRGGDGMMLPPSLKEKFANTFPAHVYAQYVVPETKRLVSIDPTFDSGLKAAGFPVAEWDGLNSTILAVRPYKTFSTKESEHRIDEYWDGMVKDSEKLHERLGPTANTINEWVDRQRCSLGSLHA